MKFVCLSNSEPTLSVIREMAESTGHVTIITFNTVADFVSGYMEDNLDRLFILSNAIQSPEDLTLLQQHVKKKQYSCDLIFLTQKSAQAESLYSVFFADTELVLFSTTTVKRALLKAILENSLKDLKESFKSLIYMSTSAETTVKTVALNTSDQKDDISSKKKKGLFDFKHKIKTEKEDSKSVDVNVDTTLAAVVNANNVSSEKKKKKKSFLSRKKESGPASESIEPNSSSEPVKEKTKGISTTDKEIEINLLPKIPESVNTEPHVNSEISDIKETSNGSLNFSSTLLDASVISEILSQEDTEENNMSSELNTSKFVTASDLADVPEDFLKSKDITKTEIITKEVIVDKGKKYTSYPQAVDGKKQLYFVVTGDRRSGKTSTALNICGIFSKDTSVLFVDLDVDRRGSLFFLGLGDLQEAPAQVQNGLFLCTSEEILKHVVFQPLKCSFNCLVSLPDDDQNIEMLTDVQDVIATQQQYNIVVIDCPVENLKYIPSITDDCYYILCSDSDATGCNNLLNALEDLNFNGRKKEKFVSHAFYSVKGGPDSLKVFNDNKNMLCDWLDISIWNINRITEMNKTAEYIKTKLP